MKRIQIAVSAVALAWILGSCWRAEAAEESPRQGVIAHSENTLKLAEGAQGASAKLSQVSWLTGYWGGKGLGGYCEEIWGQPIGDRMFGTFTLRQDDAAVFSEHMMIVEVDGSLVLKVKHFSADFVAWEEKADSVDFPLVRLGENEAYFNGLTFRRSEDGGLKIYLVLHEAGEATEQVFDLRRGPF